MAISIGDKKYKVCIGSDVIAKIMSGSKALYSGKENPWDYTGCFKCFTQSLKYSYDLGYFSDYSAYNNAKTYLDYIIVNGEKLYIDDICEVQESSSYETITSDDPVPSVVIPVDSSEILNLEYNATICTLGNINVISKQTSSYIYIEDTLYGNSYYIYKDEGISYVWHESNGYNFYIGFQIKYVPEIGYTCLICNYYASNSEDSISYNNNWIYVTNKYTSDESAFYKEVVTQQINSKYTLNKGNQYTIEVYCHDEFPILDGIPFTQLNNYAVCGPYNIDWSNLSYMSNGNDLYVNNTGVNLMLIGSKLGNVYVNTDIFNSCSATIENLIFTKNVSTAGFSSTANSAMTITFKNEATNLGNYFYSYSTLSKPVIPSKCTTIGNRCFQHSKFTEVILPSTITSIGNNCFYECNSLSSVYGAQYLKSIPEYAFYDCVSLKYIDLSSATNIAKNAFQNCYKLSSVTLSDNLSYINKNAFDSCVSLGNIIIPSNVKYIYASAFFNNTLLKYVIMQPTTPPTMMSGVFSNCINLKHIYVPDESVDTYKSATNWSSYSDIITQISEFTE